MLRSLIFGWPPLMWPILASLMIWSSVVDIERMEIPDMASLALCITGVLFCYLDSHDIITHLLAAVIWAGLFCGVGLGYNRWRGWDGLGFGDVKLIAGLALWLGFADTTQAVFAAALAGIIVVLIGSSRSGRSFSDIGQTAVAFGPFLCLSAWVTWLF